MNASVVSIVGSLVLAATALAQAQPYNVLLIVADDLGWGDLGCYGNQRTQTPHLDRLAARGVRLTNFYAAWPACTPSRASLLTGRYPQRHGLYDMIRNEAPDYGKQYTPAEYAVTLERIAGLDERETLLAEVLQEAGYRSGVVGKWDLGMQRRFLPTSRGFDQFYGFVNTGIDYFTHERYGVPSMYRNCEPTTEDRGEYSTWLFEREAERFIRTSAERPFFLYLAFNAPHSASSLDREIRSGAQAPEELLALYREDGPAADDKRAAGRVKHLAAVTGMDQAIGRLLDLLGELEIERRTAVIFLSDNGAGRRGDNGGLRGGKADVWEGGVRVPCLVRIPQVTPEGAVSDAFVTALEVFPTVLELVHARPPENVVLDGVSMLPALVQPPREVRTEMFWQRRDLKAARVGTWKWVDTPDVQGLFDLVADPGEQQNLRDDQPEKFAELSAAFAAWQQRMAAAPPRRPFRDY